MVRGWWSASNVSQQLSLSSFSQQPSSAIILLWSGVGGQLAAFLSSFSASSFSAAFSQQLFSGVGGQLAAFLSSFSQQPSSAIILLWSGVGGQLATFLSSFLSAAFLSSHPQLSSCCGQGLVVSFSQLAASQQLFSAAILSYHLAVVRGWWSASNIILP